MSIVLRNSLVPLKFCVFLHLRVDWSVIHSLVLSFTKSRGIRGTGLGPIYSTTAPVLASSSALSLPWMSECPGTHIRASWFVSAILLILLTSGNCKLHQLIISQMR